MVLVLGICNSSHQVDSENDDIVYCIVVKQDESTYIHIHAYLYMFLNYLSPTGKHQCHVFFELKLNMQRIACTEDDIWLNVNFDTGNSLLNPCLWLFF